MSAKTQPQRLVDAHQHVCWHRRDDRGLVANLDEHGIAYAWLLTWEIPPREDYHDHTIFNPLHTRPDGTHAGIPLADALLARDRHPDRFVLGYCPDPLRADASQLLRAAVAMHGVRICGEWKFRLPIDDPRCLELLRTAGELKLPVPLHLDVPYYPNPAGRPVYDPKWYGGTVDNLERALQACPETLILGHAPGFWREISTDAGIRPEAYPGGPVTGPGRIQELLDRYPNLYGDLSAGSALNALRRDPAHAVAFLTRYHDRLLFARDDYNHDLYGFLQPLDLPTAVRDDLCWRNAEKLVPAP